MKRIILLLLILHSSFFILHSYAQRPNQAYWDYIECYRSMAQDQMQRHRIPASITLAQGLLESAAGRSELATKANNHFGIKVGVGWTGPWVVKSDDRPDDRFRKYNSVAESYEDHSQFLLKPRYQSLFQLSPTDYKGWARGLKACGYATNPQYADKLIQLIELYRLYEYDTATGVASGKGTVQAGKVPASSLHTIKIYNKNYYLYARQGDTFKSIGKETGISYRKIAKYNERSTHDTLAEGDIIYLKKKRTRADKAFKNRPHVVKPGESMYLISQMYGIRLKSLYKKNRLSADYQIRVGDKLKVY